MEFLGLAVLIGLIPAFIAHNKGRNFVLWWLYGAAIWIVAFPHSLMLKKDPKAADKQARDEGLRQCPSCAEFVRAEARVCRFCQRDLPTPAAPAEAGYVG